MYEHLSPTQRERIRILERKTGPTMSADERAEYQALIAPRGIETITPAGQQIAEVYDGRDWGERKPFVGMWCVYHSLPGEGRNAKTRFPAIVLDVYGIDGRTQRWKVKLMVVWNAAETTDKIVTERTEDDRYNTWEYAEDPRLDALEARIRQLEAKANGNGVPRPPRPK